MLFRHDDGTFTGGPLDVLCIFKNIHTGRYHAAFLEEKPMPGPVKSVADTQVVRLKSTMHHTEGSDTLEGALIHLNELSIQIKLPEENVWKDPIDWDGNPAVLLKSNWRK